MSNLLSGITAQISAVDIVVGVLSIAALLAVVIGCQLAANAALEALKEHMYLRGPGAGFNPSRRRNSRGVVPIRVRRSRRRYRPL